MKIFSLFNGICFAVLLLLCVLQSCKKLVEIPSSPPNKISSAQVFADSASVIGAVAGVYNNFGVAAGQGVTFGSGEITQLTGLSSDELVDNTGSYTQFYANALLPNNGNLSDLWVNSYTNVYQINACLEGISSSTGISPALKQQLIGELEVVRSFIYFHMVNLYGGVPLVLTSSYSLSAYLPRATTADIYKKLSSDLVDAQSKLKSSYPSGGHARPNVYTASTLLAKIYLYQGDWQNTLNQTNQIVNSGLYQLEDSLDNVFLDGSKEAIWQLPANGNYNQTPEAQIFVPYSNSNLPDFTLNTPLINAFEAGDRRNQKWVNFNIVNLNGVNQVYYYPYKYKNTSNPSPTTEDYMIFRLADILLMRAEANAQLGNISAALGDINLVRKRAGLANVPAGSQKAILTAIMHERQVEMFCEWGNRWYDLKRTASVNNVLGAEKSGWDAHDALFPIPLTEIKLNSSLTQNPGY